MFEIIPSVYDDREIFVRHHLSETIHQLRASHTPSQSHNFHLDPWI
jgi:hypothetical protein